MTGDEARIATLEARMNGHETLCGERWDQLRATMETSRAARERQHGETDGRLIAIERRLAWIAGIAAAAAFGAQFIGRLLPH